MSDAAGRPVTQGSDRLYYIGILKSVQCRCGRSKKPRRAFCFRCFIQLPEKLRLALYRFIGDGFEQAYNDSCRYLDKQHQEASR